MHGHGSEVACDIYGRWEGQKNAAHLAEHNMLVVEPLGDDGGDEELGAVRVLAGVGHREQVRAVVLELEVLVCARNRASARFPVRQPCAVRSRTPARALKGTRVQTCGAQENATNGKRCSRRGVEGAAGARRQENHPLTLELSPIDALTAGTVAGREVAALEHEGRDDAVERGARVAEAVLARAQLAEVLRGVLARCSHAGIGGRCAGASKDKDSAGRRSAAWKRQRR